MEAGGRGRAAPASDRMPQSCPADHPRSIPPPRALRPVRRRSMPDGGRSVPIGGAADRHIAATVGSTSWADRRRRRSATSGRRTAEKAGRSERADRRLCAGFLGRPAEQGISLANQRTRLKSRATAWGSELADGDIYGDEGLSGKGAEQPAGPACGPAVPDRPAGRPAGGRPTGWPRPWGSPGRGGATGACPAGAGGRGGARPNPELVSLAVSRARNSGPRVMLGFDTPQQPEVTRCVVEFLALLTARDTRTGSRPWASRGRARGAGPGSPRGTPGPVRRRPALEPDRPRDRWPLRNRGKQEPMGCAGRCHFSSHLRVIQTSRRGPSSFDGTRFVTHTCA
jgi:hypothetical protein